MLQGKQDGQGLLAATQSEPLAASRQQLQAKIRTGQLHSRASFDEPVGSKHSSSQVTSDSNVLESLCKCLSASVKPCEGSFPMTLRQSGGGRGPGEPAAAAGSPSGRAALLLRRRTSSSSLASVASPSGYRRSATSGFRAPTADPARSAGTAALGSAGALATLGSSPISPTRSSAASPRSSDNKSFLDTIFRVTAEALACRPAGNRAQYWNGELARSGQLPDVPSVRLRDPATSPRSEGAGLSPKNRTYSTGAVDMLAAKSADTSPRPSSLPLHTRASSVREMSSKPLTLLDGSSSIQE